MYIKLLEVRTGLVSIFLTILFFRKVHQLICAHLNPPKVISNCGSEEITKWHNLIVSWFHALIILFWDLLCLIIYPELNNDLIEFINPFSYFLVAFSTGYFLYDFIDMAINRKLLTMWELTLHHLAVISMFFYNTVTLRCIGYNIVALLAEVNSFFLHSRKLLQMHRVSFDSRIYRVNAWANIITFFLFRGYSLGRISYGMYTEPHRVSRWYFITLCCSMFVMNVMNIVFFGLLIKSDFLRKKQKIPGLQRRISDDKLNVSCGRTERLSYSSREILANGNAQNENSGSIANNKKKILN